MNSDCEKAIDEVNATLLPIKGIGEDFFYLNEVFCSQKNLLSFETLHDYDFDDYQFQEESRKREQKDYGKKPYRGSLYLTWARLMIDDSFSYGVLSMVAGYLYCQLDEYGNDYRDIMKNFDPKIVRFRKKYKVIFHRDSGLDALLD